MGDNMNLSSSSYHQLRNTTKSDHLFKKTFVVFAPLHCPTEIPFRVVLSSPGALPEGCSCDKPRMAKWTRRVHTQHADKFIYGQVHYRDNFPGAGVDGSDDWFMCVARGHARQCRAAGRDYDVCSCCWLCVRMASPSTYAANTDPECINVSGWELLSLLDEIL